MCPLVQFTIVRFKRFAWKGLLSRPAQSYTPHSNLNGVSAIRADETVSLNGLAFEWYSSPVNWRVRVRSVPLHLSFLHTHELSAFGAFAREITVDSYLFQQVAFLLGHTVFVGTWDWTARSWTEVDFGKFWSSQWFCIGRTGEASNREQQTEVPDQPLEEGLCLTYVR